MDEKYIREEIVTQKKMFQGILISVEQWQAKLPNGKLVPREIVRHVGAAAVVPVDEDGMVTLVRQHRIAMGRDMLEIPAGKKDHPDEDPLYCASRELREETGLTAANMRYMTTLDTSPGFLTERIWLYLATGLTQGETNPDEDEFVSCVRMPLSEAVAQVLAGDITDAKTIAGLLMAHVLLQEG